MLVIVTAQSIKPYIVITLGSSSTDSEDKEFLKLLHYRKKTISHEIDFFLSDSASYTKDIPIHFRNETFREKETVSEEMLVHDIVVKMPPKKRFFIKAKIKKINKAEPKVIMTDNILIDT